MSRLYTPKKNSHKTASTQPGGGCFSLVFSPFYFVFLILAILLMANGETTQPWDLKTQAKIGTLEDSPYQTDELSPVFTPEVRYWEKSILRWAEEWKLEPNLVATVMQIESCGDPNALSPAGAIGLFQVMPYHFNETDFPYAPEINSQRGLAYLRRGMDTYQDVRLSLAAYNGGINTAAKLEHSWPKETTRYVYWGINIYQEAASGRTTSPTLEEWLASGGGSLCAQAHRQLGLTP